MSRCGRVRGAKNAPRNPCGVLERRHSLAEIVERGGGVVVEILRVKRILFERLSMFFSESASCHGDPVAQQRLGFRVAP